MTTPSPKTTGVWPAHFIDDAITHGHVRPHGALPPIPPENIQPASLDLRLGEVAHLLQCSFIPGAESVTSKLRHLSMGQIRLDQPEGAILHKDQAYLIPLMEELALPDCLKARANPKSSTGRLDIFTRVITDHGHQFDEIKEGYHGRLFLELVSRTFTIKVKSGLSLNQIRFIQGNPNVTPQKILREPASESLLYDDSKPLDLEAHQAINSDGILLSVDLKGSPAAATVGYKARAHASLLDLSARTKYRPEDYWDEIKPDRAGKLILEPEVFYLLISSEKVRIPPGYAAEMAAYEPTSGELRTHYAGFFDPGFGVYPKDKPQGTKAVMEVRARDVAFMIEHGQKVCKLRFEKMAARPKKLYGLQIGSFYQGQNLILSKHFVPASAIGQQIAGIS